MVTQKLLSDETLSKLGKEQYLIKREIGKGSFGTVYSGFSMKTMESVAIKVIQLNSKNEDLSTEKFRNRVNLFVTESNNHKKIRSKYVVKFIDSYFISHKCYLFGVLIMEQLQCDLYDLLDEFELDCEQRDKICKTICKFVNDCHKSKIAHLDLKPENVFVNYSHRENNKVEIQSIKVGDFGSSISIDKTESLPRYFGTKNYSPPEYYFRKINPQKFDIWSLAVVFHVIQLNLLLPKFKDYSYCKFEVNDEMDEKDIAFQNLLSVMFMNHPLNRPSARKVLNHEFFNDVDCY